MFGIKTHQAIAEKRVKLILDLTKSLIKTKIPNLHVL